MFICVIFYLLDARVYKRWHVMTKKESRNRLLETYRSKESVGIAHTRTGVARFKNFSIVRESGEDL